MEASNGRSSSNSSLDTLDSLQESALSSPAVGPSTLGEALLLATLPPQALIIMKKQHHREKLLEYTKSTTITEINTNGIELNGSSPDGERCSVQVTSIGGAEPADIVIEHIRNETGERNGTTVIINERRRFPSLEPGEEEIIETHVIEDVIIESEPYYWEPTYSGRDVNVIDLHFAPEQHHHQHADQGFVARSEGEVEGRLKTSHQSEDIKRGSRQDNSASMDVSIDRSVRSGVSVSEKRALSREDSAKFYRASPSPDGGKGKGKNSSSSQSDDDLVFAGNKRGREAKWEEEAEEIERGRERRKKRYMITGVHASPQNTLEKRQRVAANHSSSPNTTAVSVNDRNQSLQAGITSVEMNSNEKSMQNGGALKCKEAHPVPATRRKWHIKEYQTRLQPENLIENGKVISNGIMKKATEENIIILREIESEQNGNAVEIKVGERKEEEGSLKLDLSAPPKPPRWMIKDVKSEEDIGKPLTHSTPISTIEKKSKEQLRTRKISVEMITGDQLHQASVDTEFINALFANPRRSTSSPIVVVNQSPSRRSSGGNVLDGHSSAEGREKRRKSTITDIDWFAAFNMKEPTTPKSPKTPSSNTDGQSHCKLFATVMENGNANKTRRLSAPDASRTQLPPSTIDLSEVFACTQQQKVDDQKCQCNACRLTQMSERDRKRIIEERQRQEEEAKAARQIESHTLPRRHTKKFSTDISMDEIFMTISPKQQKPKEKQKAANKSSPSPVVESYSHTAFEFPPPSTSSSDRLVANSADSRDTFSARSENVQVETAEANGRMQNRNPEQLSYRTASLPESYRNDEGNRMSEYELLDLVFGGAPEPSNNKREKSPPVMSTPSDRPSTNNFDSHDTIIQSDSSWIESIISSPEKESHDVQQERRPPSTSSFEFHYAVEPDIGSKSATLVNFTSHDQPEKLTLSSHSAEQSPSPSMNQHNDSNWIENLISSPGRDEPQSDKPPSQFGNKIEEASMHHEADIKSRGNKIEQIISSLPSQKIRRLSRSPELPKKDLKEIDEVHETSVESSYTWIEDIVSSPSKNELHEAQEVAKKQEEETSDSYKTNLKPSKNWIEEAITSSASHKPRKLSKSPELPKKEFEEVKESHDSSSSWIEDVVVSSSSSNVRAEDLQSPSIEMRRKQPDAPKREVQSTYTLSSVKDRVAEIERREQRLKEEEERNRSMTDLDWIKGIMDKPRLHTDKLKTESEDSGIHRASMINVKEESPTESTENIQQYHEAPSSSSDLKSKSVDSGINRASLYVEDDSPPKDSTEHINNTGEENQHGECKNWIETLVVGQITVATTTVSRQENNGQLPKSDPISENSVRDTLTSSDKRESYDERQRKVVDFYTEEPQQNSEQVREETDNDRSWIENILMSGQTSHSATETEGEKDELLDTEDHIIESEEYRLPLDAAICCKDEDERRNPDQWIETMRFGPGDSMQIRRRTNQKHMLTGEEDNDKDSYELRHDESMLMRKRHSRNLDQEETRKLVFKENSSFNIESNNIKEPNAADLYRDEKSEEKFQQKDEDFMNLVFTTPNVTETTVETHTSTMSFPIIESTPYNPYHSYDPSTLTPSTSEHLHPLSPHSDKNEWQSQKSPISPKGGSKIERFIEQGMTYKLPYNYDNGSLHSRSTSEGGDHYLPYSDISLDDVFAFQVQRIEPVQERTEKDECHSHSYHIAAANIIDKAFEDALSPGSSLSESTRREVRELDYSDHEKADRGAAGEERSLEHGRYGHTQYEFYQSSGSAEPQFISGSTRDSEHRHLDVKYLSSARVLLNDTQTSSEPDEEYFTRLIQDTGDRTIDTIRMEKRVSIDHETESATNQASMSELETSEQRTNRFESHKHFQTLTSDYSESGEEKEALEIMDQPSYYLIKGIYSLIVSKGDELGKLLEQHKQEHGDSIASLDFSVSNRLRNLLRQCLKEKAIRSSGRHGSLDLSPRALRLVSTDDPADDVYKRMVASPYHPVNNPTGNVNLCTACNELCTELMREKLDEGTIYHAAIERMTRYPTLGGYERTRAAVAGYLAKWNDASVSPSDLVLVPSGNAAYDMICHCLFEENDVILAPSPTYSRTINNCADRAEVYIEPVEMDMISPALDIKPYQKKLDEFRLRGRRVRGLNLINPHNPLGVIFSKEQVIRICDWAARNGIFVIMDEVFSSCIHGTSAKFDSFLSYRKKLTNPEKVVYIWSPSKDFGLPGMKLGTIHTEQPALLRSLTRLTSINPISTIAEDFAVKLFTDDEFLTTFRHRMVSRLRTHYAFVAENLRRLKIPFVQATAAIFVAIDLRKHLSRQSFEAEDELFRKMCDIGLYLTPGSHMAALQPGWFRLVFACQKEELVEGIRRLHKFLGRDATDIGSISYEY